MKNFKLAFLLSMALVLIPLNVSARDATCLDISSDQVDRIGESNPVCLSDRGSYQAIINEGNSPALFLMINETSDQDLFLAIVDYKRGEEARMVLVGSEVVVQGNRNVAGRLLTIHEEIVYTFLDMYYKFTVEQADRESR